ncbi:MAG: ImmA/IrrE family metallo-endopeptidase [Balneolaceae bacterium]
MPTTLNIKPDLINWAISRAGYEHEEFFEKFPRAESWLVEEKQPTLPQLRDFAKKAHVPFGYLFLQEPPKEELPIPFFRTIGGETDQIGVNLRDTILNLQQRQDWIREYLMEQGEEPLGFIGRFTPQASIGQVAEDIREALGLDNHWASDFPNWQKALDHLAEKVEEAGIFIVFNSVVDNNTHRPITVEECRGFVLCDEIAPFMFVNSADSKSAQMFTIVHELAHLWIGESAGFDFRQLQPYANEVETFCDAVAAEFLVPEDDFNWQWEQVRDFEELAKFFKVSQIVIGRRALDTGKINREEFFEFYNEHITKFKKWKEDRGDGGNFYATLRKRLNPRFFTTVHQAVKESKLLYKHAYELTGLKGNTYQKAVEEYNL